MSPLAVTLMVPPLPQPASALQPAPEAMKDPARRLTACASTVTEPAFPEPELTALMLLGTGATSPVDAPRELRAREADDAQKWFTTITADAFG